MSGLATQYAPSYSLVRAHFGLGVAGLVTLSGMLAWESTEVGGFYFQPLFLGLVHLCVLGWLVPTALGALLQLVPVLFEKPIRSEKLAWAALALYVASAVPFILRMWQLQVDWLLVTAATGLATAAWAYGLDLLATLWRAPGSRLTRAFVASSLVYFLYATGLGATLAWNLYQPFLPVFHLDVLRMHAHAAALGFFGLLVMGVGHRLFEMWLLSHGADERPGWVALGGIHAGLVAMQLAFWFALPSWVVAAGVALVATGVASFLWLLAGLYRRRLHKRLDVSWAHTGLSWVYLVAALAAGATSTLGRLDPVHWDRLNVVYGLLAIPGFIGSVVMGQLYKIVPFLTWLHRFSRYVGLKKLPNASELLGEAPKRAQWALMHGGMALLIAGVLADSGPLKTGGALAFAASAVLFAGNLVAVDRRRP